MVKGVQPELRDAESGGMNGEAYLLLRVQARNHFKWQIDVKCGLFFDLQGQQAPWPYKSGQKGIGPKF